MHTSNKVATNAYTRRSLKKGYIVYQKHHFKLAPTLRFFFLFKRLGKEEMPIQVERKLKMRRERSRSGSQAKKKKKNSRCKPPVVEETIFGRIVFLLCFFEAQAASSSSKTKLKKRRR